MSRPRLDPTVLALGLVSLLTDLSSEIIFSVFAIFFTTIAGGSTVLLGVVEGLADFSASSLSFLAGWLSDRSGKRKIFALAGYGFSTVAKMILLVSSSVIGAGLFRVIERLGKGFRGPPRDAWLSAVSDASSRGYSFGVHKALDKSGAVLGPLVAWALLTWLGDSASTYRTLFWVAFVPAVASVVVLALVGDRPAMHREPASLGEDWRLLSPGFKRFLVPAGIFAVGYYSLGFLLLKARHDGFSVADIVLLYALFNVTCVISAPLAGRLGDHVGRSAVVVTGYVLFGLVNLLAMFASSHASLVLLFAIYGVFYAIDESQSKSFIADLEPERRGTAVGIYNFVTGTLYLPASLIAGSLWAVAPDLAFGVAAVLSLAAVGAFVALAPAEQGAQAGRSSEPT